MDRVIISKIRPVCWKVYAQGAEEDEYVRAVLGAAAIETTKPEPQPGLMSPSVYAFLATPQAETPLTTEELVAILGQDARIELAFAAG